MPEYMQKWAEVSSERFLDPVFRMFQSELETVYEEKNMYSDNMYSRAMQQILKLYYIGTPYEYDIIGGTDALKKPDFNGMIDFYNSYYVGNNMALVLSGDFNSNEILPILEKSFGRIPSGKKKIEELVVLQSISGRQEETVNIPIPVVKAMAHLYRGASVNSEDKVSLELACLLLNNSSGTGYLDQLTTDGKLLMAMAMNIDVANAGSILGVGAIPKLVVQSEKAAEKLVMEQVERIKKGDFTDALFLSLKNEKLREILQYIETPSGVFDKMLELYPKGLNWQNYLEELSYINEITREDVVAAANKYFTNNYIYVSKKNGSYEQDKINKPNIEPIPMNVSQESQYSVYFDSLKKADEIVPQVRYLDFNRFTPYEFLSDSCSLYYNQIKANGIFELAWYFEVGERNDPKIGMLSSYLSLLGTDSLSFQELKTALQMLGSDISFGSSNNYFDITVTGFDANFEPTIKLLNHFMNRVKGDKKMMKQLVSALKMEEVSFTKDGDNIAAAIVEKVKLGDASPYLNRISSKDMKKMNSEALLSLFDNVKQYKSSLHYTGSLTSDEIMRALSRQLSRENSTKGAVNYELIDYKPVEKPVVYFYDIPKSRQTIIYAYQTSKNPIKEGKRSDWRLLNYYWGGDMKSVMFHEVREARSMAYGAYSRLFMNIPKYDDKKIAMVSYMSTQNDKALEAVALLDSLIKNMPMDEQRFESMKRSMANNANNLYPSEREATFEIMDDLNAGYKSSSLKEVGDAVNLNMNRSEERRVGKECRL